MPRGPCRLCRQEADLCQSHIFPEFFFEPTYDESGRHVSVSSHPWHRTRFMQQGPRERLLCKACESRFARYESYAASLFRRMDDSFNESMPGIEITDIDLTTFRLFGLSLLWRAHESSLHIFGTVNLGPYAEPLRQMLLAEDPGQAHEYGFALARLTGLDTHGTMFVGPAPKRYGTARAYQFLALGYVWVFVVAREAASMQASFPFVGSEPRLYVPALAVQKSALYASIRRALPRIMRERIP